MVYIPFRLKSLYHYESGIYIPDKLIDGGIYILLCIEGAANFIVLVNIFRVVCIPVLLLGQ